MLNKPQVLLLPFRKAIWFFFFPGPCSHFEAFIFHNVTDNLLSIIQYAILTDICIKWEGTGWKVIPSRWVLGLCSWFTLVSPHLNAGISRAFSLEKPSIWRSELIQASSYIAVKNLYSLQMMKLLWNFCWRLCMPPESFQNLSYRDTAAFSLFKERNLWWRKELKEPQAFLQLHLYLPTTSSKVQWEQWPLKMWVEYELSV